MRAVPVPVPVPAPAPVQKRPATFIALDTINNSKLIESIAYTALNKSPQGKHMVKKELTRDDSDLTHTESADDRLTRIREEKQKAINLVADLERQEKEIVAAERRRSVAALAETMKAENISPKDIEDYFHKNGWITPNDSANTAKVKNPKTYRYRNPETGELHSGKSSKQPAWLVQAAKEGRKEDFRIPLDEMAEYNPHLRTQTK